jgi:hypothetical protein
VLSFIPYLGVLFGLAALICFIIYWVQIAAFSRRLADESYDRDRGYDDVDYRDRPYRNRDYADREERDREERHRDSGDRDDDDRIRK